MPRLKVFTTQSGFYDLAVAAPSQPAALRAWGIRQNLFAEGLAAVATDKTVVKAALAQPGVVLKRPLGTKGAFSEETALPKLKGAAKKAKKRPSAAARAAVREADEDLARAQQEHEAARRALEAERADVDARLEAERKDWSTRRRKLEDAGNRARQALRKAR